MLKKTQKHFAIHEVTEIGWQLAIKKKILLCYEGVTFTHDIVHESKIVSKVCSALKCPYQTIQP